MKDWIPLIATAVGVVLGSGLSILTSYVQFRRQRQTDSKELRRCKLEELFQSLSEIERYYIKLHTQQAWLALPNGAPTSPVADPKAESRSEPVPFHNMQMLVEIYAPSLKPISDDVMSIRGQFGELLHKAGLSLASTVADRKAVWQDWCTATEEMQSTIGQARTQVAAMAAATIE